MNESFFKLHQGLKREAPGDDESLEWALDLAKVPVRGRILDAGCGPGADLAMLSSLRPAAQLVGMDLHAPFIAEICERQPEVTAVVGDILVPEGKFDLIWSADAAYSVGVEAALAAWRGALAPKGAIAFSDCLWRSAKPAAAARAYWETNYPQMRDLSRHIALIEAAGYRILGARWLGDGAWQAYYDPLAARISALRAGASDEMTAVLDEAQAEIDLWRAHGGDYGYYLTVVQPK